jgi:hypothetical protein
MVVSLLSHNSEVLRLFLPFIGFCTAAAAYPLASKSLKKKFNNFAGINLLMKKQYNVER